ncbi:MAG: hypothetical protein Q7S12_04455 [bacterium]|nr:hypothetical protein [bacterium]
MMKNLPTIIIVLLVIGGGIWWYQSSSTEVVQITPGPVSGPTLELVARIKNIKMDTSIFTDQQFLSFVSQPPLDVSGLTKGRPNPFISLTKPASIVKR